MKYLRRTAGYTLLDHKRNEEILEELHVTPLEEKLCTYTHNWFQYVHRMEDNRLPKQLLNYHPKGRRRPGRPRKRLLDDMTAETDRPPWPKFVMEYDDDDDLLKARLGGPLRVSERFVFSALITKSFDAIFHVYKYRDGAGIALYYFIEYWEPLSVSSVTPVLERCLQNKSCIRAMALMTEAVRTSETSVYFNETIQHYSRRLPQVNIASFPLFSQFTISTP
jgi:hypothetical protein